MNRGKEFRGISERFCRGKYKQPRQSNAEKIPPLNRGTLTLIISLKENNWRPVHIRDQETRQRDQMRLKTRPTSSDHKPRPLRRRKERNRERYPKRGSSDKSLKHHGERG